MLQQPPPLLSLSFGLKKSEAMKAIQIALNFYLYGDQAAGTVAHEAPLWETWFQKRFPMPTEPGKSD